MLIANIFTLIFHRSSAVLIGGWRLFDSGAYLKIGCHTERDKQKCLLIVII